MDFQGSAACGRAALRAASSKFIQACLLVLLALAWSGKSQAQNCDFVQIGPTSALNPAGTSVSFTLETQTACNSIVDVAIAITSDGTGGATVQAPANPVVTLNSPYVFTVNLGPTPGGTGTVTATCLNGGCANVVLSYTFGTNNQFSYTATNPTVVINQITPATLTTNYLLNGSPGSQTTTFLNVTTSATLGSPVAPDSSGDASISFSSTVPNTYLIEGSIDCPRNPFIQGCPPPPVNFSVQVEPVGMTALTPLAPSTPAGTPLNMTVQYGSASIAAPDGTNIIWSVAGQPSGGNGAVTGNPVAGGAGKSNATFSATVPGTYTVLADSLCGVCSPGSQMFNVTVASVPYVLVAVSPNPLSGTAGVGLPVTVRLEQGGVPVPGATVSWSASAPFSPANTSSVTNAAAGEATATFTPSTFGNFTNVIVASVDIDGIPASGDEASIGFDANIAFVPSLSITGGNGQSAAPGAAFTNPLQVNAQNSGSPAAGVTINWAVTSGSAVLSAPTSITGTSGIAAIGVTAGQVPGSVTITATRQDAPSATVSFTLGVNALPYTLVRVSPNPLSGTAGVGLPVTVRLEQGGVPVPGATVSWSASAPFSPANTSSVTNAASGEATATFTPSTFGNFTNAIVASVDIDGIPASGDEASVSFNANIAFVPSLATAGGNGQSAAPGAAFTNPLQVNAQNSGSPAAGVTINWAVTSGSAVLSAPTSITGTSGIAAIGVTAGQVPGSVTITATRQDAPSATVSFTLGVNALPYTLVRVSPNPLSGTAGVGLPVTVRLEQGGVPVPGATVSWSASAPFSPANTSSVTNAAAGEATATFTPSTFGNFTNVIVASVDIDGIPASGDEASIGFDANIAFVPSLSITGGNGQSAAPGAAFTNPLQVNAQNSGSPAAGVTINWAVTSGSAVLSAPTSITGTSGIAAIGVTAGQVPGSVTITATRQDAPSATVSFTLGVNALPYTLVRVSPNPLSGTAGVGLPVTVRLEQGGVPVPGATVSWSASAPFSPANTSSVTNAASGEATATFTPSTFGNFTNAIVASVDIDGIPASGDEASISFDANIAFVPSLSITGGNGQTATAGSAFGSPLQVNAQNSGAPAPGISINWVVTSGSAVLSAATSVTNGAGDAAIGVTAGPSPGPVKITGTRQDDPAATVTFTLNVNALPYVLVPVSPNPLSGTAGAGLPVTVRLEQGGAPVPGATVTWSASAPFSPANTSSLTSATGQSTATFTPSTFGNFVNAIVASVDMDGIPASGDEVNVSFNANIAFVASLVITGGNSQNALVNTPFANPLQVSAQNSGVPAAGITINWAVTSGSATLSATTSVTNAAGSAAVGATAGATAGPVTVTGTRQDDPAAKVTFVLAVDALGSLSVIEGDGQLLAAGIASAPLQVVLKNSAGTPVAGAAVSWSTSNGTLASASSTTNSAGVASNTVTTSAAGAVQVSASSPLAAAPAVFSLNGALASIGNLDTTQLEVARVIDAACPALANLPTLTAGQQDLLLRCRELIGAAGIDPAAAIAALDQMMADVALTQVNAAFSAAQSQFINLKTRIAALRSGTGGTDFGGLAINTSMGPVSLGLLGTAFSNSAAETGTEIGTDFSRWAFFAAGTIGRGEAQAGSVNPAYDFDIEGVTAGVDYRKSDKWIIGGSFGYTRQDTVLPGDRGGLDTTGWSLSAYTTFYQADSWYMDGVLTYGRNDYELLRQITYTLPVAGGGSTTINQVAEADSQGDLLSTAFTVGRDFNFGGFGVGPYARLLYTRLGFDAIDEELLPGLAGSGLGLRIENRDVTSLASVLGAKFTYTHSAGWGVLMPHLQLEWEHEYKDDPQSIEARFINDPTGSAMLLSGDPLDTNYFRIGLGLSMVLTRGRSGFFYYERLTGMNGMSQDNLALGFRMEF